MHDALINKGTLQIGSALLDDVLQLIVMDGIMTERHIWIDAQLLELEWSESEKGRALCTIATAQRVAYGQLPLTPTDLKVREMKVHRVQQVQDALLVLSELKHL